MGKYRLTNLGKCILVFLSMLLLFCVLIIKNLAADAQKHSNPPAKQDISSNISKTSENSLEKDVLDGIIKRASGCTILTVNFAPNMPLLKSNDYKSLDEFVFFAKVLDNLHIKIVGYTANVSKSKETEFSKELSLERAQTVRDYLIENGIKPERIKIMGNGSNNPIGDNSIREGQSLNRRAELSFILESK